MVNNPGVINTNKGKAKGGNKKQAEIINLLAKQHKLATKEQRLSGKEKQTAGEKETRCVMTNEKLVVAQF